MREFRKVSFAGLGFLALLTMSLGQRPVRTAVKSVATDAEKHQSRKELPREAVSVEGLIRLDATVTDESGRPVSGLHRDDFRLFDNGQPQKLVAFRTSKNLTSNPDDSLAVIVLIDTLGLSQAVATKERQQVSQFLNQNSGKLAAPVAIYTLENSGFFLTSNASRGGEELAKDVVSDNKVEAYFLAPHVQLPSKVVPIDDSLKRFPALAQLRALWTVATREVVQPGSKLLLWIGAVQDNPRTDASAPILKWDNRRMNNEY